MKNRLFTLILLAFYSILTAQQTPRTEQLDANKRRDTYVNWLGYDSLQFTISKPKDTILTTFFYENGRVLRKEWADSTYVYDAFGQLRSIIYKPQSKENLKNAYVSSILYDYDGYVSMRPYTTITGESGFETFNRKNIRSGMNIIRNTPSVNYRKDINNIGQKYHAHKSEKVYYASDTLSVNTDTVFYENEQPFTIEQNVYSPSKNKSMLLVRKRYAPDGTLLMELLPDSLILTPFKDNVDCYYGLKNQRGDTIYTPQFDQINELSKEFWKVEQGSQVKMMRKDGKIISAVSMDNVEQIASNKEFGTFEDKYANRPNGFTFFYWQNWVMPQFFRFKKDRKFGIIDREGKEILPPQYPEFMSYDSLGFYFEVAIKDSFYQENTKKRQVIDQKGKFLLENRYPQLQLTGLSGIFRFSKTSKNDTSRWHYMGLVDKSGEVLLDATYASIELNQENRFFWVSQGKEVLDGNVKNFSNLVYGLFDPEKRTWVLPCVYQKNLSSPSIILLTDIRTQKQGIVSSSGAVILPFVYDTIITSRYEGVWAVAQNGRYQLYDLKKQTFSKDTYQYLLPIEFWFKGFDDKKNNAYEPIINFFIARKNDKWGFINLDGTIIVPFDYDYAGNGGNSGIALVKDTVAAIFSDWLFPLPDLKNVERFSFVSRPKLLSFNLIGDNKNKIFAVNANNRVLSPPQYKTIQRGSSWYLLENDAKERMVLFADTEETLPFPYKKQLNWASSDCFLGVLRTEDKQEFEIVNLKTQEKYQTISSGGLAIDQKTGTYFIKTDTPVVNHKLTFSDLPIISKDTFLVDDNNWKMFDAMGKPLTNNTFRYPINFANGKKLGVGIGAIGDKFGVWRTDGSTVLPPQYDNARFTLGNKFIILYQNIGLKNWLQLIEPQTEKTLINTGRYDGISEFYGDYALVSLGDRIGLVDTNGREIIAPNSLHNDSYNLVDSLKESQWRFAQSSKMYYGSKPEYKQTFINIWGHLKPSPSPDSLHLSAAIRNRAWHYLLETQIGTLIQRVDFRKIQRANAVKTYNEYKLYREDYALKAPTNTLRFLFADSMHISFAFVSDSASKSIFKNYWKTKAGWETKRLSEILNLSRDNILKINNLMREKLKKLEDKDIDCGESTSFIERTQNTFLAHAQGISFCFTAMRAYGGFDYVPILLTWAELKPFLTPQ